MRTFHWDIAARTIFYGVNVASFLIRHRSIQVAFLALVCLGTYFFAHITVFLRLAAIFGLIGVRILPKHTTKIRLCD
jgi:hypothetical protein